MPDRTNDQTLLDELLERQRTEIAPDLSPQEFMEIFTAQQLLKDRDLSYEEIESGVVDGSRDGGIDSVYTFVAGRLLQDDSDFSDLREDISIELNIIQSKTENGFKEDTFHKLLVHLPELLHLSTDYSTLQGVYNTDVLSQLDKFRQCYRALSTRFPTLVIAITYATKGDSIHPNVERLIPQLRSKVGELFSNATIRIDLLGATALLTLARRVPSTSFQLTLAENPISTGAVGYLCLVSLVNYNKFITNIQGELHVDIFDANVRDYQGQDKQVNAEIRHSLRNIAVEDFWWLNNGVTVIAQNAVLSGKTLTIRSPQVVNGLQTSREIYDYFRTNQTTDTRNLLVRVLVSEDAASTDRIIKATNSQTPISPGSLRATDSIQRQIEDFMLHRGLFYDRRRNYYKNAGKPILRIITIRHVAQAVASILLQRPHDARANPSDLIRNDTHYDSIFDANYPIAVFWICVVLSREVDRLLKDVEDLESRERKYLRLHVAMVVASRLTQRAQPSAAKISEVDVNNISAALVKQSLADVRREYLALGASDRVAKSKPLTDKLKQLLEDERCNAASVLA